MPSADDRRPTWTGADDEALMGHAARGDPGAFAELVRRHQRRVFNLAFRSVGNASDADDLTQEVFLRVYRAAGRYQPTARFTTWLYRVATNAIINWLRHRDRQPVELARVAAGDDQDEAAGLIPDPGAETGVDALARAELRQQVRSAIAALPDKQRLALILFRFEEQSYQEIGEALDLSVMAVKSLLSRARENLRGRLGRYVGVAATEVDEHGA